MAEKLLPIEKIVLVEKAVWLENVDSEDKFLKTAGRMIPAKEEIPHHCDNCKKVTSNEKKSMLNLIAKEEDRLMIEISELTRKLEEIQKMKESVERF